MSSNVLYEKLQCTVPDPDPTGYGYPFEKPEVFLEGAAEYFYPQSVRDWTEDAVIVKRDSEVMEYRKKRQIEVLIVSPDGKETWVPGNTDVSEMMEEGWAYTYQERVAQSFKVIEYDLEKKVKRTYVCEPAGEEPVTEEELRRLSGKDA